MSYVGLIKGTIDRGWLYRLAPCKRSPLEVGRSIDIRPGGANEVFRNDVNADRVKG